MPRGSAPRDLLPSCALALSLAALTHVTPHAQSFQDLIPELATRIAAAVAPVDRVQLVARDSDADDPAGRHAIERELGRLLAAHRLTIVDRADGAAVVRFTCSDNVRQRICAADVEAGGARHTVTVERWRDSRSASAAGPALVLAIQPVFAQRAPILDLAILGSRLIVLDPGAVSIYERGGDGWRQTKSRPLTASGPWPRDARGRLRIDGSTVETFLPGMTCRGSLDSLALTCMDTARSWPIGIDNAGIAAGRNVFAGAIGVPFFSAATLGPDAGARWLVATVDQGLVWIGEARQAIGAVANGDRWGDDLAAVATPCETGTHVIVTSRAPAAAMDAAPTDTLRVLRVAGRQLTPVTPPATLPGIVTALWTDADASRACVVSQNAITGNYEAFHASVVCGR